MSKNSATDREALKAQLFKLASKPDSPGSDQAKRAVKKAAAKPGVTRESKLQPKPVEKVSEPKAKPAPKKKVRPVEVGEGKAEKISVSLHPIDQERAELVEDALRKAGLVGRRAPTSFLLKIALAAFDANKVDDLKAIVEGVRAQDGRGKWMNAVK